MVLLCLGAKEFASEALKATSEYAAQAGDLLQEKVPEAIEGMTIRSVDVRGISLFLSLQLAEDSLRRQSKSAKSTARKRWTKPRSMRRKYWKLARRRPKDFSRTPRRNWICKILNKRSLFRVSIFSRHVRFLIERLCPIENVSVNRYQSSAFSVLFYIYSSNRVFSSYFFCFFSTVRNATPRISSITRPRLYLLH